MPFFFTKILINFKALKVRHIKRTKHIMEFNLINPNTFVKNDFLEKASVEQWDVYESNIIKSIAESYSGILKKSETVELSEEEEVQLKVFKAEINSLNSINVVNDDLTKETVFYRHKNDTEKCNRLSKSLKSEIAINKVRLGFEKGLIDEAALEKATGERYFKREGVIGNYKYYYTEAQYNEKK